MSDPSAVWTRRDMVGAAVGALGAASLAPFGARGADSPSPAPAPTGARGPKTEFQIACMTLPYHAFSFERALRGIRSAGYRYVALGTTHRDASGRDVPILAADASEEQARRVGRQCREAGLEPLMMFSMIYPENPKAVDVLTQRIRQAAAAGIPQVLTFGHTEGGNKPLWIERFRQLGPVARRHGVLLVVKQHGGSTGTGAACAEIVREVNDPGVWVNYDAGNVMDYLDLDPIPDILKCADVVRSFCIKDHRNWPRDEDCGPGLGEIDHYRLLDPVAWSGRPMPLCCENISAPLVRRPTEPEILDAWARRAREFLEIVIEGLHAAG